ncbi:AAA family ATPase [Actinomyces naeslundii]|jgi:putative septum site-determining protein|uniref:AAA family ATPase n=1 Tax=Actinomyces naeslundii TaxID=1655 RepID=UPI00096F80CE|nr:AAA family ATPase [Actinomyces naeslundii]OMG07215.1 hypothetical protein BKH07_13285 [Actinomyces naeslundii]OMG14989.1 hypothetical protein BKH04_13155 [Actinomyces naeslundii]OMG31739.1 hypothetical protein BKH25_13150 [Actinomyces naeslundii]PKY94645.1 hypothetical protein CYJ18_10740 [Actinomyces naeslundii]
MALFIVSQNREVVEQVRATLLEIDASFAVNAVGSAESLRMRLQDDSEGHVVLIDLHINDGLGLDLAREVTMSWPLVATLLLTTERGNQIYESALDVGARDVLPLPASLEAYSTKVPAAVAWTQVVHHRVEGFAIEQQRQIGRVIAVVGAKGGVGTSLLALLLARELARRTPTCLIDLDLRNGDLAAYCGARPQRSVADLADVGENIGRRELDEASFPIHGGIMLLAAPKYGEAGETMGEPQVRRVVQATRYQYAAIILDCGSRLDDVQAAALDFADEILVVATPDIPSLRAARRLHESMERLDIARSSPLSLVLNKVNRKAEIQPSAAGRLTGLAVGMEVPGAEKLLEPSMNTATVLEQPLEPIVGPLKQWVDNGTRKATPLLSQDSTMLERDATHADQRSGRSNQLTKRGERNKRGKRRGGWGRRREQGQILAEAPVSFALITLTILVCIQLVFWGASHLVAANAAKDAARYYAVGMPQGQVQRKVADRLPWGWGDGLKVGSPYSSRVDVSLSIPSPFNLPPVDDSAIIQWER